ncbi:MAG: hypothetical protein NC311_18675, partial [Muribaculaceae bacterium]|nr:hypothetical protein [Muribaculaceae bacterium]
AIQNFNFDKKIKPILALRVISSWSGVKLPRDRIAELKITYMDYVSMNQEARDEFRKRCADEEQLQKLSTTYRMYKYSKWYKELHTAFPQTTIITYTLADRTPMEDAVSMS